MAVTGTKWLAKLARLTLDLKERWKFHSELQASVEAADRAGLVVSGERWLLSQLDDLLEQASTLLAAFTDGETGTGADATERLAALEAIINDNQWEVAVAASAGLAGRVARMAEQAVSQQAQASNYQNQIREWQARIVELTSAVDGADKAYAPVSEERRTVAKLDALVKSAERALAERKYSVAGDALSKLSGEGSYPPDILERVRKKLSEARPLARQADLLLIRSDLSSNRYQYTLLLRTPRGPGTSGIDIQDESTMVMQDHKFFEDAMDEITAQINDGLVRAFKPPSANPPEGAPVVSTTTQGNVAAPGGTPVAAVQPAAAPAGNGAVGNAAPGETEDSLRLRLLNNPMSQATRTAAELVQDIGDLMYRLVVPETMQRFLTEPRSSLTIRTNDVELPWELMRVQTPNGPEFLCLERPVARMPTGRAFPRRETNKDRTGQKLRFLLVYSDPDPDAPLTAAGREIQQLKEGLSAYVEAIDTLMPQEITGKKLNRILLDGEYDVIHYAGHAAFDEDKPDLSGLLLYQKEVFFAQKVRRLLEGRPLVFVNACESGRTANEEKPQQLQRSLQRPAEGIISSFIYGGAANCIGSVWPVYDQSAAEFAITFYRRVVEGFMVGEALRQARLESRAKYPKQITWASFVLYGDPTARLAT